ncbi:short-chain fatty acyl-CoA regulator family protein [Erythrobacter sp. SDW2]|uniref:helix-turn-helix domain-containing protein n=1 Tax=Erythrobacter sp. SDW2 TaxID=2907154 RepID=UPI001F1DED8B|nr:short-chain fatty acyl-CoA regulator family protein [Erythrobacter sp. SDW2]UIP05929.1 short-chain fatty acyl-CoA regulator family protein [Erythrobacter sp. SDW2]
MAEQSLFAGAALRRLRKREGITQAAMANRLGISSSYLTLMERNQRAVTARVIVQLAEEFGFDPRDLREDEAIGGIDGLARRLGDERFNDLGIDRDEVVEFLANAPQAAAAFARLFDEQGAGDPHSDDPLAACRREIDRWRNHFADLDVAAEQLADELRLSRQDFLAAATDRLREKHHLAIRILPREVMPDAIRRLDFHARQVQLSEMLSPASRNFELALQIAELEQGSAIASIAAGADLSDHAARKLFERHLSEYFAAALMMPYGRFLRACDATAYDVEVLTRRFGASVELVAQRLTTLHRVGQRGLPFFMARFDRAGQFSKRIAGATGTALIEGEHSCPLWQVHHTFGRREGWLVQPVMLEESAGGPSHWLTMSYAVASAEGASSGQFAIVLGVEARLAADLAMAQGVSLQPEDATRIGLGCARCYWRECRQRSLPPKGATLNFELIARANLPYSFS